MILFPTVGQLTEGMTVVLYGNTQNLERMHADRHALHPLLTFENEINRTGEQVDERVTI